MNSLAGNAAPVWLIGEYGDKDDARTAARLGLGVAKRPPAAGFYLARDAESLALHHAGDTATPLRCALADRQELATRRTIGRRAPLARALGLHRQAPMAVLDTTAGLARDAVTLAMLGCTVTAIERQPALFALLADASARLAAAPAAPEWLRRWRKPIHADARAWLEAGAEGTGFDAIYLDPMFASPRRKSQPQKALAWLAQLAGPDADAGQLLTRARAHAGRRVVVKQHGRAAPLAPPDFSVAGRAIRFDVYLTV